jgi:MFS family permease
LAEKQEKTEDKVKKSLNFAILDGFFYSVMVGFGESFLSAFAIFLKATNEQIGLLGSLPQALGSLSQLFSRKLMRILHSRKKVVLFGALASGLMYIPITLAFFLGKVSVPLLLLFICLYWISTTIIGPAWNSWMGDLVDKNERGAYFGKRNRISGFATFFSFLIGGYLLQQFVGDTTIQYIGYVVIFGIALIARIFSFIMLSRQFEPEYKEDPGSYFSFLDFMKKARFNNYGMFVIYNAFMNFGVYVSAPFFTAYMLKGLNMSYIDYTLISAAAILMKNISMPIWGKAMDRFGARKVLTVAGFTMPIVPILWAFSHNFWYLIGVQLYSGLVWAAFDLATFTFIFDVTTPQKRASCVAYFNVLNGATMLAGALIGGFILARLPASALGSSFLVLFIISGILRYMSSFIFLPKIKEARTVEPIPYHVLFLNVVSTIPTTGSFIFTFLHEVAVLPVKLPKTLIKEVSEITKEISISIKERAAKRKSRKLAKAGKIEEKKPEKKIENKAEKKETQAEKKAEKKEKPAEMKDEKREEQKDKPADKPKEK